MIESAKKDTGEVITLRPFGSGGVDLFRDTTVNDPTVLARAENVDFARDVADRRKGALKLAQVVTSASPATGRSHTFGSDTKYATFTPPLIPAGGWAIVRHFTATWPGAGLTAYLLSSRPNGQTFHVIKITMSDAGVITVTWRDQNGSDRTVVCTAVADGTDVHLFAVYDAVGGTFTVYINGSSSGTPLTGLSATLRPDQTAGVVWALGLEKETGAAVTTNTFHSGKDDGLTLFTLRGTRPSSGTTTLIETLRRHSSCAWPNPRQEFVLAHYDLDEAGGTTMYDRSEYKNHGTYAGGPSTADAVALLSAPCNHVGTFDAAAGKWNLIGFFGALFTERLRTATT